MPTTYAHYRFGCDALVSMPDQLQQIVQTNRSMFDFGVHGPDLLFYHNPLVHDAVNSLGYACHELTGAVFFSRAARAVNASGRWSAALSYALGVLCHFALDRECHPYVAVKECDGVSHSLIEASFDRYLMLMDGKTPGKDSVTTHLHPSSLSALVISGFYPPLSAGQILSSQRSMVFLLNRLNMPAGRSRTILEAALNKTGKTDFADMLARTEDVVACADSDVILLEKYSGALMLVQNLISEFMAHLESGAQLGDCFMHTFGTD